MKKATQLISRRSPERFVMDNFEAQRDGELDTKSLDMFERSLEQSLVAQKWVSSQQELIYQLQLDAMPQFSLTTAARQEIQGQLYNRLRRGRRLSKRRVVFTGILLLLLFGFGIAIGSEEARPVYIVDYPGERVVTEIGPPQLPLLIGEGEPAADMQRFSYGLTGAFSTLRSTHASQMIIDDAGTVWFLTPNSPMYRFDGRFWQAYDLGDSVDVGAMQPVDHVAGQGLWLADANFGVAQFNGTEWQTLPFNTGFVGHHVNAAATSSDGLLWVGTDTGMIRYDGFSWQYFNIHNGVPYGNIHEIVADSRGDIWFTSLELDGIARFDGQETSAIDLPAGLSRSRIAAMVTGPDDSIWIGSYDGLFQFDGQTWQNHLIMDGLVNNDIKLIEFDATGRLWAATDDGLWRFSEDEWTPMWTDVNQIATILALNSSASGDVWALTNDGVHQFTSEISSDLPAGPAAIEPIAPVEDLESGESAP